MYLGTGKMSFLSGLSLTTSVLGGRWGTEPDPARALHPETAQFFTELRKYLGLSEHQAAAVLHTGPDVIARLEAGDLAHLPAWPEVHRIVSAYLGLAGIDPDAALASLEARCSPPRPRSPQTGRPVPAFSGENPSMTQAPRAAVRANDRRWPVWRIAGVAAAMGLIGLGASGSMLQAAMTNLPAPIAQVVRSANDAVLAGFSRKFEGMAWIDVDDPRSRRSDKLRKAPR